MVSFRVVKDDYLLLWQVFRKAGRSDSDKHRKPQSHIHGQSSLRSSPEDPLQCSGKSYRLDRV